MENINEIKRLAEARRMYKKLEKEELVHATYYGSEKLKSLKKHRKQIEKKLFNLISKL